MTEWILLVSGLFFSGVLYACLVWGILFMHDTLIIIIIIIKDQPQSEALWHFNEWQWRHNFIQHKKILNGHRPLQKPTRLLSSLCSPPHLFIQEMLGTHVKLHPLCPHELSDDWSHKSHQLWVKANALLKGTLRLIELMTTPLFFLNKFPLSHLLWPVCVCVF